MKKTILPVFLLLLLLVGCMGEKDAGGKEKMQDNAPNNTQMMTTYSDDSLSFDIPASWQKNFKAVTRDVGSSGDTYPQTDFYYTEGDRDIRLMSVGKFTREQWEKMKRDGTVGDDSILGESGDKNHVYSIFFEDHDYITDEALRTSLGKIRSEAEALRSKMKIK